MNVSADSGESQLSSFERHRKLAPHCVAPDVVQGELAEGLLVLAGDVFCHGGQAAFVFGYCSVVDVLSACCCAE